MKDYSRVAFKRNLKYCKLTKRIGQQESRQLRAIDERFVQLAAEVSDEKLDRGQQLCGIEAEMKDMEDELVEQLEGEKLRAQDGDKELVLRVDEEVGKLRRELQEQTESREACESEIYELMKNIVVKIKEEIELEKKSREATQENLLSLLEETCHKIELMANNE